MNGQVLLKINGASIMLPLSRILNNDKICPHRLTFLSINNCDFCGITDKPTSIHKFSTYEMIGWQVCEKKECVGNFMDGPYKHLHVGLLFIVGLFFGLFFRKKYNV